MTDREALCAMFLRAGILFQVDNKCGWTQRIVVAGDRCFVFDIDGALCGIRSTDDNETFDDGPWA